LDDASVSSRVKAALLADAMTDGLDIEVEVDRGRLQLNGFADSEAEVARATEIANSVQGVASIQNNLQVTEGSRRTGEYIDDKVLLAKINAELAKDELASALTIDVEVNRGVVSLGGFVDSENARDAAVRAAQRVDGVREIDNNLAVR
jgi:hyperosmotically inducible protein